MTLLIDLLLFHLDLLWKEILFEVDMQMNDDEHLFRVRIYLWNYELG